MSEETSTSTERAAAAVAARRRARKSGDVAPPMPTPEALDAPVDPGAAPVTAGRGGSVLVASSLTAEFAAQVSTGVTGARIPTGDLYGTGSQPLVQPMSTIYGTMPHADNYVIAEFDAEESMVPPGCRTSVSRLLWQRGWRVRKDFYEAVSQRRSAADQEAARLSPAKLPAGVTEPPAAMVVTPAAEIATTPGAPA
jgi:hypothetical protein